jgi:hypothetical protein
MARKQSDKLPKLDAEAILRTLADIRSKIPKVEGAVPVKRPAEDTARGAALDASSLEEFEYLAVQDGLESLLAEVEAYRAESTAKLMEAALNTFYAAEELSRDPAHADLIPQVEQMRAAYLRDTGKPIPPKKKE